MTNGARGGGSARYTLDKGVTHIPDGTSHDSEHHVI